jgi:hypothetical protein
MVAAWLLGFGAAAAGLAIRRRRQPGTWAVFGAILGPAALALLQVAPPGRCWSCAAPTEGWMTFCVWCGEDTREPVSHSPKVSDAPGEAIRVHGPLTVIDGSVRRPPMARIDPNRMTGRATDSGSAPSRDRPASPIPRAVEPTPIERRIEVPSRPPLAEQAKRVPLAVASATVEAVSDPVRRLKASLGQSGPSIAGAGTVTSQAAAARVQALPDRRPAAEPQSVVLASAIYVTGSRGLQAGSRYGIAIAGDDLRILGPVDINPTRVAIRHPLSGMDATGLQGRLIITATDGRRDQFALVFMSVAGNSPEGVADAIIAAAGEHGPNSR